MYKHFGLDLLSEVCYNEVIGGTERKTNSKHHADSNLNETGKVSFSEYLC